MRCSEARKAILARTLGSLSAGEACSLEDHLHACDACAAEERFERDLVEGFTSLRTPFPFEVDVTRRVVGALAAAPPPVRDEVPGRSLGWAAAAAAVAAAGLLGVLAVSYPLLPEVFRQIGAAVTWVGASLADLGRFGWTLLAVLGKSFSGLTQLLAEAGSWLSRVRPIAEIASAVSVAAMVAASLVIVGRDLLPGRIVLRQKER